MTRDNREARWGNEPSHEYQTGDDVTVIDRFGNHWEGVLMHSVSMFAVPKAEPITILSIDAPERSGKQLYQKKRTITIYEPSMLIRTEVVTKNA